MHHRTKCPNKGLIPDLRNYFNREKIQSKPEVKQQDELWLRLSGTFEAHYTSDSRGKAAAYEVLTKLISLK
jgi:hypothetical protein